MTLAERALKYAESELREYAFASPVDFAASLEEFALREVAAAVTGEREACAKRAMSIDFINWTRLDPEMTSGNGRRGARFAQEMIAEAILKRGQ